MRKDIPAENQSPRSLMAEVDLCDKMRAVMRYKLEQHREKGHWKSRSLDYLRARLVDEMHELFEAMEAGAPPEQVWKEAGDVGNFAAMLADNYAAGIV